MREFFFFYLANEKILQRVESKAEFFAKNMNGSSNTIEREKLILHPATTKKVSTKKERDE